MSHSKLHRLFGILLATICVIAAPLDSQATPKGKPKAAQQVQKERLVLMPLRVGEELQSMQGAMESALVNGLQQKYAVMWGEEVEKKAKEIFHKENLKHECNEERCMQGIAEAFQSELLATANVTKQEGGYVVMLTIQNLYDHVVVFTSPLQCIGCNSFQVVDKLKELGVAAAPVATVPATAAVEPPPPKITATDPESTTWVEAQKGNTADDYQVYLDTYPKGKYVPFAKAKIKKLKEAEQAAAEQQEQQVWDTAQQESTEQSFNRYLQGYPNGRFVGFAKSRISKLKADLAFKEESDFWKNVEAGNDKTAVESYLNKYPAGRYIVAASAKLKTINEENRQRREAEQRNQISNFSTIAPARVYSGTHLDITGAGATFPYPVYAKWAEAYKAKTGVGLNYQSIGSGGGIKQIIAKTVDFGASDKPLTREELDAVGLLQFPTVVGGVVPVINVEGIAPGQLKLTGEILAEIFLGKITNWNDSKIAAENKGVSLPDSGITVIHRADGSGTTFLFTNYLSQVSASWKSTVGANTAVAWPSGMGAKGNEGVAAYVSRIKNSIGYVEAAYAWQNKMTYIQLKNRDGQFVSPSSTTIKSAAANAPWSSNDFYQVLTDQPGSQSWPICGATFILMHTKEDSAVSAKEVLMFFDWAYSNGGKLAEDLDYVSLPGSVIQLIRNFWSARIKDSNGGAIW